MNIKFRPLVIALAIASLAAVAIGQKAETFTGTALTYGEGRNLRTRTLNFKLYLKGETSDEDAARFLNILKNDGGQDALQKAIEGEDLGTFSLGNNVGQTVNAVRSRMEADGMRHIYVVFSRWLGFSEVRGGYRSLDYPFSYIELVIDPRTGTGDGTYIGAARIRFKDKTNQIEVENFATFPSKLMGVKGSRKQM